VISIGFAFCTIIILKQMYFLHHGNELGFSFKNRGSIWQMEGNSGVLANQMKQIPEIIDVIDAGRMQRLSPPGYRTVENINLWEDKPANAEEMEIQGTFISPEYIAFYDLRLVAGEMLTDADPESMVMINESAVKAFGWHDPVGKHFGSDGRFTYTVKGIVKDVYNLSPTVPAKPFYYINNSLVRFWHPARLVSFKYHEGMWKSCKEKIENLIEKEHGNMRYVLSNDEEEFDKFLKSERALIKLLSFVSAICILICIFGFVSLISLTCEERRKSIAIRKVSGATAGDILAMFAKEYFALLIIGSVIAFTVGYAIMQRWLEHYAIRTSIPLWIYLSIICVLALVIVLCVGWQVYKSSIENPADVVKGG
jgi:ABC-type antimicrobial peptide transport system permease subunit